MRLPSSKQGNMDIHTNFRKRLDWFAGFVWLGILGAGLASCGIYKFKDTSGLPADVKTIKIGFIDNKASYVNPQVAQKFYDKLQQKIIGSTRLTRTNDDNAHYVLNGTITTYNPTQTVGVSDKQASTNRLTVTLHMVWRKNLEDKTEEFDVSRSFDYSANLSLQQAESSLLEEMVRTLTDDIFNRMFSNW